MTAPRTVAWFHCFNGIAGDMALGSLIDAGADLQQILRMLEPLPVRGWGLETEIVMRGGIGATRAVVHAAEDGVVRTHAHISGLIEEARLPDRVRDRSLAVFAALAEVEGKLHRRPPSQVHFHEVGGIDAIVDIVGTCCALEVLGVDEVRSSPVATGRGMVRAAHGLLPNPAPAVVELLRGAPTYGVDVTLELTTPTGAALLAALATGYGPMPPMVIGSTGFGAGTRELDDRPNVTQVVIGTLGRTAGDPADDLPRAQPVAVVEANVDDATGEVLGHTVAELLEAGAHDAWITPIVGKKGRPAHLVSAVCDVALVGQVSGVLARETGSMGVRATAVERWPSARRIEIVDVEGRPVRVKVGPGRVKAEFDDAARVARLVGLPVREVTALAEQAWRERPAPTGGAVPHLHAAPDPDTGGDAHDDPHPHDHGHPHDDGPGGHGPGGHDDGPDLTPAG